MAIAGSLEVQMFANVARLTMDMAQARNIVGSTVDDINKAVGSAKSMLASLGIGLGVGYFVHLIKGSIDTLDHFNDLSKTTNILVGDLAGLGIAAKQSGGDLDSIAQGINKLSVNIGKDQEKFKALGITAKEPLEAFKQLADVYVKLDDPQQRAAVMAAALGKAWAGAAPLLSEGGAKIGEMVEKGKALAGVTEEATKAADDFNDKWVLLTGTGGLLTKMVTPLLPLLNTLADNMLAVQEKSAGANTGFGVLLETGKAIVVLFANVSFVLQAMGREIGAIAAQQILGAKAILKASIYDFAGAAADLKLAFGEGGIGDQVKADAVAARADLDALEKSIMNVGSALDIEERRVKSVAEAWKKYYADEAAGGAKADAAARAKAFLDGGAAAKAFAKELERLQAVYEKISNKDSGLSGTFSKDLRDLFTLFNIGKINLDQYRLVVEALIKQQPFYIDGLKRELELTEAYNKVLDELDAHTQAATDKNAAFVNGLRDQLETLKVEASTIGMSNEKRIETLALFEKEKSLRGVNSELARKIIGDLQDEIIAINAQSEALKQQASMWDSLGNTFGGWVQSFKGGWHGAMDYAKNQFGSLVDQVIAFFGKQLFLNLVIGGSAAGSATANAATSALGSMGSSVLGTGLSAAGSYLFGAGAAAGGGAAVGTSVGGLAMGTGATTGAMSSITAGLAAIPVWGWIAVAALAAYAYFGGKGGGPKSGGTAIFEVGADGSVGPGQMSDARRFYSAGGNTLDSLVAPLVEATAKSFAELLKLFGGKGQATFTQSMDTDPQGTAMNRLATQAYIDGFKVFEQKNEQLARDGSQNAVEAQLQLERALIAGLQGVGIKGAMGDLINGVVAATLSQADFEALIAKARELQGVITALDGIDIKGLTLDSLRAMQLTGESISQTLARVTQSYASANDALLTDAQKMANASALLTDAFNTAGVDLPKDATAYLALRDAQDLSTISGRNTAAMMNALAATFRSVADAAIAAQDDLNAAIGARNPEFARASALAQRNTIAQQFADAIGADFGEQLLARMALNPETFTGLSTAAMNLLTQFLGLQTSVEGFDKTLTTGVAAITTLIATTVGPGPGQVWDGTGWVTPTRGGGPGVTTPGEVDLDVLRQRIALQGQLDDLLDPANATARQQAAALAAMTDDASRAIQALIYAQVNLNAANVIAAAAAAKEAALVIARASLQGQLDDLLDPANATARQQAAALAAITDDASRAIQAQIFAQQGLAAATAAAAAAAALAAQREAELVKQRTGLQGQLDDLLDPANATARQQAAALAAITDDASRAIQALIFAQVNLNAANVIAATAAAREADLVIARAGLQGQLDDLLNPANATARQQAAALAAITDDASREIQRLIFAQINLNTANDAAAAAADAAAQASAAAGAAAQQAAEAQLRAAEDLKSAWQSVTDSIIDEVNRIRGLVGTPAQSAAYLQAQFATATAAARAGDIEAAKLLPGLSHTILDLVTTNARDKVAVQRAEAQMINSLATTAGFIGEKFAVTVTSDPDLLAEMQQLRTDFANMKKVMEANAASAKATADSMDAAGGGGGPFRVIVVPTP